MKPKEEFTYTPGIWLWPLLTLLIMWSVFAIEHFGDFDFYRYGIYPRDWVGLRGIVLAPFIHGHLEHIWNNSISVVVLLLALRFFYRKDFWPVVIWGTLGAGVFTWIVGRGSFHIGISGLIYALFAFMFFKGIRTKYYRLMALSLAIILFYGGMIWYVFPNIQNDISWEGHMGGFLTGLFLAFYLPNKTYVEPPKYRWEFPDYDPAQDQFMQLFDENGHFMTPEQRWQRDLAKAMAMEVVDAEDVSEKVQCKLHSEAEMQPFLYWVQTHSGFQTNKKDTD